MTENVLTTYEAEELSARIRLLEEKEAETIGEGYESGAAQDGHHDEGYQLSKRESRVLSQQIANLREVLNRARIQRPIEQKLTVQIGTGVLIEDAQGVERFFIICGYPIFGNGVSATLGSPIGKTIFGAKVGDSFEVTFPRGREEITVIKIFSPSEARKRLEESES